MDGPSAAELGLTTEDLGISEYKSVTGKELPANWPKIASPEEESKGYGALYDPNEDRSKPPSHSHIERLSYTLRNGEKELRFLATQHIMGAENRDHPQFKAIKENFETHKPQIVLYEGPQGNPAAMTEEAGLALGEKGYIQYLVLEHNKNLKPGEKPAVMESCDLQPEDEPEEYRKKGYSNEEIAASEALRWMYFDTQGIKNTPGLTEEQKSQKIMELQAKYEANPIAPINPDFFSRVPRQDGQPWTAELVKQEIEKQTGQPLKVDLNYLELPRFKQMFDDSREFRDQHVIRKIAEAGEKYDKVMVVMGSGHAIRDKDALVQFYESKSEEQQGNADNKRYLTQEEVTDIRTDSQLGGRLLRTYTTEDGVVTATFISPNFDNIPDEKREEILAFLRNRKEGEGYRYESLVVNSLLEQFRIGEKFGLSKDSLYTHFKLNVEDRGSILADHEGHLYLRVLEDHVNILKQQGATDEQLITELSGHIFHESAHNAEGNMREVLFNGKSPFGEIATVTAQMAYYLDEEYDGPSAYTLDRFKAGTRKIQDGVTSSRDYDVATYVGITLLLQSLRDTYPSLSAQANNNNDPFTECRSIIAGLSPTERQKLIPALKGALAKSADKKVFEDMLVKTRQEKLVINSQALPKQGGTGLIN